MTSIITKNILLSALLLVGFTSFLAAKPALPVSTQVTDNANGKAANEDKIEIVPEIKIQAQASNTPTSSKLKEGVACSDENLEEVQGKLFSEIPMAKTIPCDTVDCKDLAAARMHNDDYVALKNAKTISCEK